MKRENPPSPPRDEAVALAQEAKRQKKSNAAEAPLQEGQVEETKAERIPYQDVLKSKNRHRLPDKIMRCLCDGIEPDVLWWSPHENGFTVDADTVQEKLLDVHFRGTKLSSLVRSLNRWGFRRDFYRSLPKKALAFLHPQFQKRKPQLLRDMKICSSTTQVVDSSEDEDEPPRKKAQSSRSTSTNKSSVKTAAVQPQMLGSAAPRPNELQVTPQPATAASFPSAVRFDQSAQTASLGHIAAATLLQARQVQQAHQAQQSQLLSQQLELLQAGLLQPNALQAAQQLMPGNNALRDSALLQVQALAALQQNSRSTTNVFLQQQPQPLLQQLQALCNCQEPRQNPNDQLQRLILAKQREDALRMLQLNQLQQLNPQQRPLAASLPAPGIQDEHEQIPQNPSGSAAGKLEKERNHMNSQIVEILQRQIPTNMGTTPKDGKE